MNTAQQEVTKKDTTTRDRNKRRKIARHLKKYPHDMQAVSVALKWGIPVPALSMEILHGM